MCSKCFNESQQKLQINQPVTSSKEKETIVQPDIQSSSETPPVSITPVDTPAVIEKEEDKKVVQVRKDKCFMCKAKVGISKQITNKCRCGIEIYLCILSF